MSVDEFIRINADPVWLHQNEMWEYIDQTEFENDAAYLDVDMNAQRVDQKDAADVDDDIDIPF